VRVVIIASVMPCRVNGGGFNGIGWVDANASPATGEGGTGLCSIGNNGSPVFRSRT
jgi:hypothetical protein